MRAIPGAKLLLAALAVGLVLPLLAQDTVTVPKSRLEELERKERELERLKGDVNKTRNENARLKNQLQQAATNAPAAPVVARVSPPLESLPPLQTGAVVESADLANYYQSDPAAADRRFRNQHLTVRGEVVGFEKPLWRRDYRILLQGPDKASRVVCNFYPPDNMTAVFTSEHGTKLVGLVNQSRVPLARLGEQVRIKGLCQGWREGAVLISAGELNR